MVTLKNLNISLQLVTHLIGKQFPQWANLPIRPVEKSGWDNRTFRLGEEMLIRLPSAQEYAEQVHKEQKWLPFLAKHLSYTISTPLALGDPSEEYPYNWSVYKWIKGTTAETVSAADQSKFAHDIARFLKELQSIDTSNGPLPGDHNYWRGASPVVYNTETRLALTQLKNIINVDAVAPIWEEAIHCPGWNKNPVWIHGDFAIGNILVNTGRLVAVIDFGCMGIGDPACDLVIAWTFLTKEARKIFKSELSFDSDTWARARGWAIWKALITLAALEDKNNMEALKIKHIINEIITDYELDKTV